MFKGKPSLMNLFKAIECAKHVNVLNLPQTPGTGVYKFEFPDGSTADVVVEIKDVQVI